jgi:plasmid maintenance system antidote protein VapI
MKEAREKLQKHRDKALKQGVSPAAYAQDIGISAQRIGRLLSENNSAPPTLAEAVALQRNCKIKPDLWI